MGVSVLDQEEETAPWSGARGDTRRRCCLCCAPCARSNRAVPVVLLQPRALADPFVVVNPWYSAPVWAGGALLPSFHGGKQVIRDSLIDALSLIRWVAVSGFELRSQVLECCRVTVPSTRTRGTAWGVCVCV